MTSPDSPTLSVVVPTRNRSATLRHCLRTITSQDYPRLQIIVSDNCSADDTGTMVAAIADPRISYIRTPTPVSMTDNWNFGLAAVTGDFVTFIGDDDGFVPGGIAAGMGLLKQTGRAALTWKKLDYHWPDHPVIATRNLLQGESEPVVFEVEGRKKLALVLAFQEGYNRLPCIYNSLVDTTLVRRVQELSPDRKFFGGLAPDIYSGIALSPFVGKYLELKFPLTINGASGRSNGVLHGLADKTPGQQSLLNEFFELEVRRYDPDIVICPSVSSGVMGEFLLARGRISTPWPEPRWDKYVKALVREAGSSPTPAPILASARHTATRRRIRTRIPGQVTAAAPGIAEHRLGGSLLLDPGVVGDVGAVAALLGSLLPSDLRVEKRPVRYYTRKLLRQVFASAKDLYRILHSR